MLFVSGSTDDTKSLHAGVAPMSNAQLVPTTIEISDTAASLPIIDMSGLRSSNIDVRAKVGLSLIHI